MRFKPLQRHLKWLVFSSCFFCLTCAISSCGSRKDSYKSPPGYDFKKPIAYKLPAVLDEISGIIYYPKDSSLFAIQDEKGWLFKIHLKAQLEVERWKFSNGADYEDIAQVDTSFYVLRSKGVLERFSFSSGDSVSLQSFKLNEGKNEFETLYFDSTEHALILLCKNCEQDKKTEVSSWAFDSSTASFSASYKIETAKIREQLGEDEKFKFKPSAAAYNPVTGELYVIASVSRALVILNKDHSVKSSFKLDPGLFKQPEGMTFTTKGDLIISNEAADHGAGDLLFFKYKKNQ